MILDKPGYYFEGENCLNGQRIMVFLTDDEYRELMAIGKEPKIDVPRNKDRFWIAALFCIAIGYFGGQVIRAGWISTEAWIVTGVLLAIVFILGFNHSAHIGDIEND